MLAYVRISHQAYVADDTEAPRSYTEISLNYFADYCCDNTHLLSRQSQFVRNSIV